MSVSPPAARRLWSGHGRARWLLALAVAGGAAAALLALAQAVLLAEVVHRVFRLQHDLALVRPLLGGLLAILLARAVAVGSVDLLAQRAASRVKRGLRQRLTAHLFQQGPAYTHGERSGELSHTAVTGVESLDAYITQYLPARALAGLAPALAFLAILVLDPWTTLVLLFAGPMLILLLALIGARTRDLTTRRFAELSWMSAHFLDILQGLPTLKAFGRSREQEGHIQTISRQFGRTTMEVLRTAFQTALVLEWSATAATALVALEVGLRLMADAMPFNRALAVLLLTPEFFLPLRQLALRYHAGTEGQAAAERIFAVLDTRVAGGAAAPMPAADMPAADMPAARMPARLAIRFERVSKAYAAGRRPALHDFSLTISPGQSVALVGATGAGKSTVAALLLRFYEPDGGRITVDDRPLAQLDPAAWRAQVAWVPQHPHLFHGTVADNIGLGRPSAGRDAVARAARLAHAHDFILALPQGYDTPIGEQGARLSGGQRQRLAIARAFLKDAPLLILDEATAHLDGASEGRIAAALARLMRGRTVLIIAHRLSLAAVADRVVVMAGGRAVQSGPPAALLAREGPYRALAHSRAAGQAWPGGDGQDAAAAEGWWRP